MASHVALLRGVNVGRNMLKMERLRELCAELRMRNARTYVQSGNVVFHGEGTAAQWARTLERRLAGETRLPVSVMVRTAAELQRVLEGNPFLKEKGIDLARLHVTFLETAPGKAGLEKLAAIPAGADRFRAAGADIYLHCPGGYGRSKLANNAIERALAMRATTRNWNTVNKLYEMCRE